MVSIVIADDHTLVREGIRALLERAPDIQVIAEAADGRQAVELVKQLAPDVLLMDLSMPRLNGIGALQQLAAQGLPTRVIVVSVHRDEAFVTRALRYGAKGYLLKDSFKEELFLAIQAVARGEIFLGRHLQDLDLDNFIAGKAELPPPNPIDSLSPRERQVLQLIVEGKTNREVSQLLGISIRPWTSTAAI
ncbi:MAG: response regulator transcription factor [Chloroflexi bacterium]|nr:response regulator transcription factor [Chloroflexota bacterium]